ncbi:MAG: class I poly(R)-hydroxyalkanoic acid synthase [Rhodospirillales bacterium]|nr:class I poly(R)-hydroxyalkanoic acid synthase [Rhodospirillales bacterium]MCB9995535.1 class I poly(R)-hydroxyalkanoic acid synthase [Rhodospirillales bacterium]
MHVAERSQPILQKFFEQHDMELDDSSIDPMDVRGAYLQFLQHLMSNPQKLFEMQMDFWQDWVALWQESAIKFMGGEGKELYKPDMGDRRFKSAMWQESAVFDFIKQSYLLTSRWMENAVQSTEGLDDATKQKLDFYTRQFINAMAPSNFLLTNPDVLQETLDSNGENLVRGLENLLEDLERGRISTTDYDAFVVGENLATTKGKVIFQNDLIQLLQYEATTDKVFKRPLLIVPPWINKFYILDLQQQNSFIKWLVDQGHTVFTISWVNPDKKLAQKRFEDYMEEGVFAALEQVKKITKELDCNCIGYCLGGTLLSTTLAWMAAKKKQDQIASATFLTTLIDFERSGEMKLFMDDAQIEVMEKSMTEKGYLDAGHLRKTFSLLRSNDLIWSFVINNYLMGKEPFPFDLLYWNDDATNMPAAMHSFYLRKCYRDNLLVKPGGVTMNGVDIDMTKVKTPCYFLSTKDDHIAPWQATYAATQLIKGPCTFTLAASGHVAGVINPPAKNKYCYWKNTKNPSSPYEWLDSAKAHDGSWWPDWQKWIEKQNNGKVVARKISGKALEDAPGSYVRMKAD